MPTDMPNGEAEIERQLLWRLLGRARRRLAALQHRKMHHAAAHLLVEPLGDHATMTDPRIPFAAQQDRARRLDQLREQREPLLRVFQLGRPAREVHVAQAAPPMIRLPEPRLQLGEAPALLATKRLEPHVDHHGVVLRHEGREFIYLAAPIAERVTDQLRQVSSAAHHAATASPICFAARCRYVLDLVSDSCNLSPFVVARMASTWAIAPHNVTM